MNLEHYINQEILKAEKRRLEIFMVVVFITVLLGLVNYLLFPDLNSEVFSDERSFSYLMYMGVGFLGMLFLSKKLIRKISHKQQKLPYWYQVYSVCMECIIPGVWLYLVMDWERNTQFLDSPVIFLYLPIIVVSALHLNFWISFITGTMAAVLYGVLTWWSFRYFDTPTFFPDLVYYTKAFLLLLAGASAGYVASELRKRIFSTVKIKEESKQIETLFNQQVSRQVADALRVSNDTTLKAHCAVMFLDMRNFTRRVQNMSPEQVNAFQNTFFQPILEVIHAHDGMVNQILGDGVMATFGPEGDIYESEAYRAGCEILSRILELNKEMDEPVEVGIGLHSGDVLAGNIGIDERKQFSISGIPVLIAARLEQLTKTVDGSFLVSGHLFGKIQHLAKNATSLGLFEMKGISEAVEVIKIA